MPGDADGVDRRPLLLADQEGERAADALEELLRVPQPLPLLSEANLLTRLQLGCGDLVDLKPQHVGLASVLRLGAVEILQLASRGEGVGVSRRVLRQERVEPRGGVQKIELPVEVQELRVLQLAVKREAAAQHLLHDGSGAQ